MLQNLGGNEGHFPLVWDVILLTQTVKTSCNYWEEPHAMWLSACRRVGRQDCGRGVRVGAYPLGVCTNIYAVPAVRLRI